MIEADTKYPTDAGLASHGVRSLAREGRKLAATLRENTSAGARPLALDGPQAARDLQQDQSLLQRGGEGRGPRADQADRESRSHSRSPRRAASPADGQAQGQGLRCPREAPGRLPSSTSSPIAARRSPRGIKQRVAGERITDRLISLSDPDARPIRKGKLGKPNEFGYVADIAEITPNTRRGARGRSCRPRRCPATPARTSCSPQTVTELQRLGLSPKEVALDGGFALGPTTEQLEDLDPERVFISGRQQPGSRRTQRRLQRYRTGAEGRISHLKRGYGMRRSRLKGDDGQKTWTGWGILVLQPRHPDHPNRLKRSPMLTPEHPINTDGRALTKRGRRAFRTQAFIRRKDELACRGLKVYVGRGLGLVAGHRAPQSRSSVIEILAWPIYVLSAFAFTPGPSSSTRGCAALRPA